VKSTTSDLTNLFASFTDIKETKTNMQRIPIRMDQLQGASNVIKECEMCGKGYGWTNITNQNMETTLLSVA
jgi:hypothetical protein